MAGVLGSGSNPLMKLPTTSPSRTRMERFAVGLAVAVMVLSASTLAGWWFGVDELLRPFGPFMPIQINAAIAFGTLAAAALARDIGRPRLAIVATIPILLGLISLAENAFNSDLRIDELLGADRVGQLENPGRMCDIVAIGVLLAGGVILWRMQQTATQLRLFVQAMVGSLLASAGLSTILGYAAELPMVYMWGGSTALSPLAAGAL